MNQEVKVYWETEQEWFSGVIDAEHETKGFHIRYYDGDEEWFRKEDIYNTKLIQFPNGALPQLTSTTIPHLADEAEEEIVVLPTKTNKTYTRSNQSSPISTKSQEGKFDADDMEASLLYLPQSKSLNSPLRSNSMHSMKSTSSHGQRSIGGGDDMESIRSSVQSVSHLLSNDVVLATGKVLYANNLPPPIQEDRDGRIFFRVLYAGSSDKNSSALFQCKTTVFESDMAVELSERIEWKSAAFKFEIDRLPEDLTAAETVPARGDIILAIYRQRSFGGNEFVGQTVVAVDKLCSEGVSSRGNLSKYTTERRSVKTVLRLYDRSGASVLKNASLALSISLSWRSEVSMVAPLASPRRAMAPPPMTEPVSMVPSAIKRVSVTSRPKSAGATIPRPSGAPIPSTTAPKLRMNKAQKEFQWKVERENKSMQSRLAKHATKTHDVSKLSSVYGKVQAPAEVVRQELREMSLKDRASVASRMPSKAAPPEDPEYNKLLTLFNNNKAALAKLTDEKKELTSKLNRLKISSRKWEVSQERLGKASASQPVSEGAAALHHMNYLSQLERGEKDTADVELREMLNEYRYLQATRRSLRGRLEGAHRTLREHQASIEEDQAKLAKFQASALCNESKGDVEEEKQMLLQQLDECKVELLRLQGLVDLDLHTSDVQDVIDEAKAAVAFLKGEIAREKKTLELLEYERDLSKEKMQSMRDEGVLEESRNRIVSIRREIIRKRVEAALPPIVSTSILYT